jgi:hypothetical protein
MSSLKKGLIGCIPGLSFITLRGVIKSDCPFHHYARERYGFDGVDRILQAPAPLSARQKVENC